MMTNPCIKPEINPDGVASAPEDAQDVKLIKTRKMMIPNIQFLFFMFS